MYKQNGSYYAQDATDATEDATPERKTHRRRAPLKTPVQRVQIAQYKLQHAQDVLAHETEHAQRYDALQSQVYSAIYSHDAPGMADRLTAFVYRLARGGSNAEHRLEQLIRALENTEDAYQDAQDATDNDPYFYNEHARRATEY